MDNRPRPPRPAPRPGRTEQKEPENKGSLSLPSATPPAAAPPEPAPAAEAPSPAQNAAEVTDLDGRWAKKTVEMSDEAQAPLIEQAKPGVASTPDVDGKWAKKTVEMSDEAKAPLIEQTRIASGAGAPRGTVGLGSLLLEDGSDSEPPLEGPGVPRWVIALTAVAATMLGIGLGLYMLRKDDPAPRAASGAGSGAPSGRPAPTTKAAAGQAAQRLATLPAPTAPKPSAAPATAESAAPSPPAPGAGDGSAEAEARDALSRLRAGILACARDVIGFLPGTSPAVPESLAMLKSGAYPSAVRDWSTPVWACAKFRQPAPQRFQLQWQMTKPGVEGMGVAWLDDDADGKADHALAFRATLKQKGIPEMGEVERIEASHPITRHIP